MKSQKSGDNYIAFAEDNTGIFPSEFESALSPKVEGMKNPVGIDVEHPLFSWKWSGRQRQQTGFRIEIYFNEEPVADSGIVRSEESCSRSESYFTALPMTRYGFTLTVWFVGGEESQFLESVSGTFETGRMGIPFASRRVSSGRESVVIPFTVKNHLRQARMYIAAGKEFDVEINRSRCTTLRQGEGSYRTMNITDLLAAGKNVIAVERADYVVADIELEYEDGSMCVITPA